MGHLPQGEEPGLESGAKFSSIFGGVSLCFQVVSAIICFGNKTERYPRYQIAKLGSDQIPVNI